MRKILFLTLTMLFLTLQTVEAQQYTKKDSIRVMELLLLASQQKPDTNWMVFFSRQLCGVSCVKNTLEKNKEEQLVVNMRQLDCTTFVEVVLALTLCMKNDATTFDDYCRTLQQVRYRDGIISYPERLHYFTDWIDDNTRLGFVEEQHQPEQLFTGRQTLLINYISYHASQYPMLTGHPEWQREIRKREKALSGRELAFIPKAKIANDKTFREAIHDGDILVLTTSKRGLDTAHIGIAVWHKDGLHLLNASMIHKKVVEEPMTLKQYMQKHPSQTGLRVIRVLP